MKAYGQALLTGAGAVGAAIVSALCCAGPVLAIVAGVSGAGLAARFDPLRPWFLGATAAFLLLGFWIVHREERKSCEPARPCADERTRRRMKIALWLATGAALMFATFPKWQHLVLADAASEPTRTASDSVRPAVEDDPSAGPYRTIALEVTGMT